MGLPTNEGYFWEPYEAGVAKGLRKKGGLQICTVGQPSLTQFELYLYYFFLKLKLVTQLRLLY